MGDDQDIKKGSLQGRFHFISVRNHRCSTEVVNEKYNGT